MAGLDSSTFGDDGGADDGSASFDVTSEPTLDASVDTGGGGGRDSTTAGDDTGSGGDTGTGDDVANGDDASDTGTTGNDAPSSDGCAAQTEVCTDGIDNDCNGLVDCADPACAQQGYSCFPTPPGGWAFVAFSADAQPGCAQGQQANSVDVDPVLQSASCSCTCNVGTAPTCTGRVSSSYGTMGGTCPMMGAGMFAADGTCINTPLTLEPFVQVGQPANSGGTCAANPTTTVPAAGSTRGQVCSGQNKFGGGCSGGTVCALAPSSFEACVAKNGQNACPSGAYTNSHFVGTLDDTRGCGPCKCNGTPSCALTWAFYPNPNCNGQAGPTLHPDGTCQSTGTGASTYASSKLTGDATNASCPPPQMQPTPTGQLAINAEQTVCCM
jgi:hypothetical protein